jgi:hypothetical protein
MSKQTAVEWLAFELLALFHVQIDSLMAQEVKGIFQQAKAIEKQQMDKVAGDWWNEGASYMHDGGRKHESFEQYYNETFNTKEK